MRCRLAGRPGDARVVNRRDGLLPPRRSLPPSSADWPASSLPLRGVAPTGFIPVERMTGSACTLRRREIVLPTETSSVEKKRRPDTLVSLSIGAATGASPAEAWHITTFISPDIIQFKIENPKFRRWRPRHRPAVGANPPDPCAAAIAKDVHSPFNNRGSSAWRSTRDRSTNELSGSSSAHGKFPARWNSAGWFAYPVGPQTQGREPQAPAPWREPRERSRRWRRWRSQRRQRRSRRSQQAWKTAST
jgi:hypothetical protein